MKGWRKKQIEREDEDLGKRGGIVEIMGGSKFGTQETPSRVLQKTNGRVTL